ncbi:MAG: agmatinase [Pirellulales bacterium]|nr:agmatinase [Pirellulales bacterium]
MSCPAFLDLCPSAVHEADVLLLPLPFEASVSYGSGTAYGPEAIWRASTEVELWDEQLGFDMRTINWYSAPAVVPVTSESPNEYLNRVERAATELHSQGGLVVGVGGEHSVTPALVRAARGTGDLSGITVVQFDAHADLRDTYDGSPYSHACAMRRLVELSADVLAIGIRSASAAEAEFSLENDRIHTFPARLLSKHLLPGEEDLESKLLTALRSLEGDVYLTIDIDVLEVHLCPATGTPQPGGLGWWQALSYLHALLVENHRCRLIGFDLVETVPHDSTQVNEFTSALLISKVVSMFHKSDAAEHRN